MQKRICHIIGAGDFHGFDLPWGSEDYIIAVDGGLRYLEQEQIGADLVIGDFDSLNHIPEHPNVMALSCEKDETDTLAAVNEGIKAGYETFCFYACTGGRIEHTIANIQTLTYLAKKGKRGFLFDRDSIMSVIINDTFSFPPHPDGFVSIFSLSEESNGVSEKGLKYGLDNVTVTNSFPIGVSNEFIGEQSTIEVKDGTLLIVFPRRYGDNI